MQFQHEDINIPMTAKPLFARSYNPKIVKDIDDQQKYSTQQVKPVQIIDFNSPITTKPFIQENSFSMMSFCKTPEIVPLRMTQTRVTRTQIKSINPDNRIQQLTRENEEIVSVLNELQFLNHYLDNLKSIQQIDDTDTLNKILQDILTENDNLKQQLKQSK